MQTVIVSNFQTKNRLSSEATKSSIECVVAQVFKTRGRSVVATENPDGTFTVVIGDFAPPQGGATLPIYYFLSRVLHSQILDEAAYNGFFLSEIF